MSYVFIYLCNKNKTQLNCIDICQVSQSSCRSGEIVKDLVHNIIMLSVNIALIHKIIKLFMKKNVKFNSLLITIL